MSLKYSICIVAYKDYGSLKRCIDLIQKREQLDYEILIWDNTPDNLREIWPSDIFNVTQYVGHEDGFSKAVNRLSQIAKGEILVFINPDTEPNGDWLDRMAKGLDSFDYIGCTSDYIAGIQKAAFYLDEHREFVPTKLIIPVCAVIRKSTFLEMGGFDEQFFLGCEDLDFSWRMNLAGKKMGIATDVFIHHVGHTGFELTPNKDQIIKDMEFNIRAKLKAHYGDNVPRSEELWGCKILATEIRPQTLSICMIAPDEFVPPVLFNLHEYIQDVQVIIEPVGDSIEDFAEARNKALAKCRGDWILWLDTDDMLDKDQMAIIKGLLQNPGNHTALQDCHFGFQVHNVDSNGKTMDIFSQSRLFPRIPGVKWGGLNGCHGYVHETIWESALAAGLHHVPTDIVLKHTGYSDPDVMKKKQKRNMRLLLKEPKNCFTYYNIGQSYASIGDFEKAQDYYQLALEVSKGESKQFIDHICYTIAICLYNMGKYEEAQTYLEGNDKPDAMQMLGSLKILYGQGQTIEDGCDLLWKYLKIGQINDVLGTNYIALRKASVKMLTDIGVLA